MGEPALSLGAWWEKPAANDEAASGAVVYMRARYYDPAIGRFISEDPTGFGGGDVNLYAYVGGNPINGVDPNGLQVVGLNFGGGVTIPFTNINVSGSVAFAIDSNFDTDAILTGEIGAGTPGGGVFARGLFGAGDNAIQSLQGFGVSASLSAGRISTSISLPVRATPGANGFPEGDFGFFPPVFELGVGFGTPFQSTVTGTFGSSLTNGKGF